MHTAVHRLAQHYEGVLRSLNILYREGGAQAEIALIAFDCEKPNIVHARAEAEKCAHLDRNIAALCVSFARGGAALINLRFHPRERVRWIDAGIQASGQLGDRGIEARLWNDVGVCHAALGEMGEAQTSYRNALEICRDGQDHGALGAALGNLANLNLLTGKPQEAIELLNQVAQLSRETGDQRRLADALNSLGAAYKDLGEYARAIDYHEQSLAIHRKIEDFRGQGSALVNIGVARRKSGDARGAIEYYEQSLPLLRSIRDERGEGDALWNMSLALQDVGELDRAIDCASGALEIRERLDDPRARKVRDRLSKWTELRNRNRGG